MRKNEKKAEATGKETPKDMEQERKKKGNEIKESWERKEEMN